ncbi:MAG: glycosyltransferase N-terminal domain-containing protein [Myxococcota bacterium]
MTLLRHSGAALLGAVALPAGALALALRPRWREGWRERLGARDDAPPGAIWLHGASVGEAAVVARLAPALSARGYPLSASLTTSSGRARLKQLAPDMNCALAPLDHPWCVDRVLSALDPAVLILVETELWPCLIAGASRRGVPIALVSGRLSDRSFKQYRRFRWGFARSLSRIDFIGARSAEDAGRFVALGAEPKRVEVTGDLKLEPLDAQVPLPPELEQVLGECPLIVAGSTHSGEEQAALEALAACVSSGLDAALVLAPRRPDRCDSVADLVARAGRTLKRRSRLPAPPLQRGEVLLLDTLGELPALYARAVGAFVGGSLVPRGGHNLLEPAQSGIPVCFGPYTENVRESAIRLEESGAGRRVLNVQALAAWAVEVVGGHGARTAGQAGRELTPAQGGPLERTLALISPLVEARS